MLILFDNTRHYRSAHCELLRAILKHQWTIRKMNAWPINALRLNWLISVISHNFQNYKKMRKRSTTGFFAHDGKCLIVDVFSSPELINKVALISAVRWLAIVRILSAEWICLNKWDRCKHVDFTRGLLRNYCANRSNTLINGDADRMTRALLLFPRIFYFITKLQCVRYPDRRFGFADKYKIIIC